MRSRFAERARLRLERAYSRAANGSPGAAQASLWSSGGIARTKFWPSQIPLYDAIRKSWGQGPFAALCHRNAGKSTVLIGIADEECRRVPNTPCALITDTKDHAQKIADEKMSEYLEGCPRSLRPVHTDSKHIWRYRNGSILWLYGADDHRHIKTLRGLALRFVGLDEAGHIEGTNGVGLSIILRSILLPSLAKRVKTQPHRPGQVVLASTSPLVVGHEFWSVWKECEAAGRAFFLPISGNADFTDEYRAARAAECGGFDSPDYRREYECAEISDPNTTVLPNVTRARIHGADGKPALVQQVKAPTPREWYRAMDIGGKHLTGVLWGFYELADDSVQIVAELTDRNASAPELAEGIRLMEKRLWGDHPPEYLESWADNNNLYLLHELDTRYGIRFYATRKDEKMAQLSSLRQMISDGKLILDLSCVQTLATFRKAQWAQGITSRGFAETPEIGHADLLDAALYLVRNVRRRPYPVPELSFEEQIGAPWAKRTVSTLTPGMQQLRDLLSDEGPILPV